MFLENISINYTTIFFAAMAYFILGTIWYSPAMFGQRSKRYEGVINPPIKQTSLALAYIGELLISFFIAYTLAVFIQITQAKDFLEKIVVVIWIWFGFVATTHFSPVLWDRKTLKSFFVHAGFMLFGFLLIGSLISIVH
ncbi:DUF1761 domain-containing protein [Candidatus Protochlamydia amoebophila]|uniref:DUF1761 domain-containing protein n=1 Tax=Protochlamydia amoebophila (strain UWE25) TaxID=264201 RepID=Q6MA38_PARUW|nr:DUF1761 domain-containing protein [Candidatus Protochlamydia amoebophila]CAF24561.1 unnamed protein product [Candidatus Protochlamydia amoebophila UWE25]